MEVVILTVVFFALAALGFGLWWFSGHQVGKRRLQKVLTTPIAEAPEGAWVKVTGTLTFAGEEELEGPLTGRRCAGYVIEVKERMRSGANVNWETIITKEDAVAFVIEDATGKALVKAGGAHLVLVRDGHVRSGDVDEHSERAQAFLMAQGTPSENVLRKKKAFRYEEGVLEPGEEVSVLGVATWTVGADGVRHLVVEATEEHPLTISDDPSTL
ncbi:MAG: GIDE domain-containing protein [Sandaracinaceae bacterium]